MRVYIKEWSNRTATIMTSSGQVVWTFSSVAEARQACHDWHNVVYAGEVECRGNAVGELADSWCLA